MDLPVASLHGTTGCETHCDDSNGNSKGSKHSRSWNVNFSRRARNRRSALLPVCDFEALGAPRAGPKFGLLRNDGIARQRCNQFISRWWCWNAVLKNVLVFDFLAVELFVVAVIRLDRAAVQGHACKRTLRPRVSEHFRLHQRLGVGGSLCSHGACHCGPFTANGELAALHELFGTGLVHHQHDDVGFASADLEAEATALKSDRGGSRPSGTLSLPAICDTDPILTTDDKTTFLHPGNDRHAARLGDQLTGDALVRCGHDLLKDLVGLRQPFHSLICQQER